MPIVLTAHHHALEVTHGEHIVEGAINAPRVEFVLPENDLTWAGLTLVATFKSSLCERSMVLDSKTRSCKFPWEVNATGSAGSTVSIGLSGAGYIDGAFVERDIVWVTLPFRILDGSGSSGVPQLDPTPSQYQQLLAAISKGEQQVDQLDIAVKNKFNRVYEDIAGLRDADTKIKSQLNRTAKDISELRKVDGEIKERLDGIAEDIGELVREIGEEVIADDSLTFTHYPGDNSYIYDYPATEEQLEKLFSEWTNGNVVWDGVEYQVEKVDFSDLTGGQDIFFGSFAKETDGFPFGISVSGREDSEYSLRIVSWNDSPASDGTYPATVTHRVGIGIIIGKAIRDEYLTDTALGMKVDLLSENFALKIRSLSEADAELGSELDALEEKVNRLGENTELSDRVNALEKQIADMNYKAISITSISHGVGTKEKGETVTSVNLSWAINKTPKTLTISGTGITGEETLAVSTRSKAISGLSINVGNASSFKWTVKATDERDATSTKTTGGFTFLNCVYYGAAEQPTTIDSEFIKSLAKKTSPTSTRARSIQVDGGGKYIWYCLPTGLGACTFKNNGFPAGIELVDTISFTNALGYTENYYVYRSNQKITDTVTIEVS